MWLNPPSANKTNVAIGGIIKEMKPGKILVEDDEGKVSVAGLSRRLGPLSAPILHSTLSPTPLWCCSTTPGVPESKWGACIAGQTTGGSCHGKHCMSVLGTVSIVKKQAMSWQMENSDN